MARFIAGIVSLVLLAGVPLHASEPPPHSISVELCDLAHLPRDISQAAQRELIRTFRGIGVEITVARCGERHVGGSFRVAIVVLPPTSRGAQAFRPSLSGESR
jgi:hypothetical protein